MKYRIVYTASAKSDLKDVYLYIAHRLLVPSVAEKQVRQIMRKIRSLEDMPMRHRLYEHEPWHSQGLRILPVGTYIVLYLPDEASYTVEIVRIMYGGRDVLHQLGDTMGL